MNTNIATEPRAQHGLITATVWLYAGFAALSAFMGAIVSMLQGGDATFAGVLAAALAALAGVLAWRQSVGVIASCRGIASAPARAIRAVQPATAAHR